MDVGGAPACGAVGVTISIVAFVCNRGGALEGLDTLTTTTEPQMQSVATQAMSIATLLVNFFALIAFVARTTTRRNVRHPARAKALTALLLRARRDHMNAAIPSTPATIAISLSKVVVSVFSESWTSARLSGRWSSGEAIGAVMLTSLPSNGGREKLNPVRSWPTA